MAFLNAELALTPPAIETALMFRLRAAAMVFSTSTLTMALWIDAAISGMMVLNEFRSLFLQPGEHGGFQAGKAEIKISMVVSAGLRVRGECPWKQVESRVSLFCQFVNHRAGRIGQAEHLAGFVERLSGGIVKRPADYACRRDQANNRDEGMAAGNSQRNKCAFR